MWFDCVKRKRRAKLPLSTTAHRAFAAAPSFPACLRALICTFCMCVCIHVYVCMCADMYIYVYICMCVCICTSMRLYTCVCVCICVFVHGLWVLVSVQLVDGVIHAHVFSFTYISPPMRMCVGIYICAFFCRECYMHFTGVLGTSAWAGVYVTQVCFYTIVHICEHTCCRLCTYVYMYICVYMHVYAYGCRGVCVSII